MLHRILGVVVVLAAVGIMVFGGFFLFPGGNLDVGLLALIIGLGLLGVGAALLGRPASPFTR
jgi:hypothetical protein